MKRAICAMLAACSIAAVAAEPPGNARQPRLPEGWKLLPDGQAQGPDGKIVPVRPIFNAPGTTCYFIRTIKPVSPAEINAAGKIPRSPEGAAPAAPRLIPLQAQSRVAGVVNMPVCAQAGKAIEAVSR